jgi:hypothetical protein
MAKRGVKIKDLALELGLTSRELIDRCRAEGIPVQNSITKLAGEHEQAVRAWFSADADQASANLDPKVAAPGD